MNLKVKFGLVIWIQLFSVDQTPVLLSQLSKSIPNIIGYHKLIVVAQPNELSLA